MSLSYDICIRGDGIVARTLALHLAARQLRVALVAPEFPAAGHALPDVRAYALNAPAQALLQAVRCWPDEAHATPVLRMQVRGDDGSKVCFDASEQGAAALNWIVDVPALEERLEQALCYVPLVERHSAPQNAKLTVVCEGRASASRLDLGVPWQVQPYGQTALATRVRASAPHAQTAHQWFHQGEIAGFLPLGGAQANEYAVVWSVSPERALALEQADEASFCRLLQEASQHALGTFELSGARKTWALQHALAQRWCGHGPQGAWVLAGDAAHNVHPLAGQGLNLGLGDVAELVRVLTQRPFWREVGDMHLLRAFERARKAEFALIGVTGDGLQRLFHHSHPAAQLARNWGLRAFEHSGFIKHWVARRAMGAATA